MPEIIHYYFKNSPILATVIHRIIIIRLLSKLKKKIKIIKIIKKINLHLLLMDRKRIRLLIINQLKN